jgi:hypothetical protein
MSESPRETAHRLLDELIAAAARRVRADRAAARSVDARGPLDPAIEAERREAFIAENRSLVALQKAVAACAAAAQATGGTD